MPSHRTRPPQEHHLTTAPPGKGAAPWSARSRARLRDPLVPAPYPVRQGGYTSPRASGPGDPAPPRALTMVPMGFGTTRLLLVATAALAYASAALPFDAPVLSGDVGPIQSDPDLPSRELTMLTSMSAGTANDTTTTDAADDAIAWEPCRSRVAGRPFEKSGCSAVAATSLDGLRTVQGSRYFFSVIRAMQSMKQTVDVLLPRGDAACRTTQV